jgi:hypothetical protein
MAFQDTRETSAAEFEYTRITLGAERDPAADIAALNAAGRLEGGRARSGWRLVTIVSNPVPTSSTPYFAYLMRERR